MRNGALREKATFVFHSHEGPNRPISCRHFPLDQVAVKAPVLPMPVEQG
jgi:hypothetical protein